jgi:hypothetical protein
LSKYLFDSNVFIQAKNFHYQFCFCQGFWDWILSGHDHGLFFSSKKVLAELKRGHSGDGAKAWAESAPSSFFLDDARVKDVMAVYANVINWAYNSRHYLQGAKDEFAREEEADAFLVALAAHGNYKIVTNEKSNPDKRNRILLPDAALAFDVETVLIYDLLSQHATSTFQLTATL